MTQTKTYNNETDLNNFLAKNSSAIKVINISTKQRGWSWMTGFLGSGKTIYTVAFEIINQKDYNEKNN